MSIDGDWNRNSKDFLWDTGCCLICNRQSEGCWCNNVKCHECEWYEGSTIQNEEYYDLEHLDGYCTFPSSNFGFPIGEEVTIKSETEKAFLIKLTNYPSFWVPKKACKIGKDDGNEWITLKGWFLLLKYKEYEKKDKRSEEDDVLSELFCDMPIDGYID